MILTLSLLGCGGETANPDASIPDAGRDEDAGRVADGGLADAAPITDAAPPPDASEPLYEVESFQQEVWTWDQTVGDCSYSNMGNFFWDWFLHGREPVDPGRYPVFIHLHGTGDQPDTPVGLGLVQSMARRGFVAASVGYDTLSGLGATLDDPDQACPVAENKADCIFGSGEGSAVTLLCAREKADCSRGIVVSGHSQGAVLAILGRDVDDRVRAVYAMGAGLHGEITIDLGGPVTIASDVTACASPEARALPADRLRVVNGESEHLFGDALQADVRALTDMDCPAGTLECLRAGGSGWTFFPDAANEDGRGTSEHCYMSNSASGDCGAPSTGLNSIWTEGTASYSREPNLSWLRSLTDP